MLKNKLNLLSEIKEFQDAGSNIYIGKLEDIKKDSFYTNDLCIAGIARTNNNDSSEITWTEMQFKYVFERFTLAGKIYYREIFSGAILEMIDLNKLSSTRGMFVISPIPYNNYTWYLNSLENSDLCPTVKRIKER